MYQHEIIKDGLSYYYLKADYNHDDYFYWITIQKDGKEIGTVASDGKLDVTDKKIMDIINRDRRDRKIDDLLG